MPLTPGTRLGPYEIGEPIGAGGMGEVYRSRDTRLDRDVAIKVLPERIAVDADALARFEREAKAVAAISHPGILAIYDFGTEGQTAYAVLELLEGATLREELASGALPTRKCVDWAAQMAHGLAAAHDKGICHRDLKPENVFVTRDGQVKILDFGLAKQGKTSEDPSPDALAATRTSLTTEPGTVMGTVGYMAPEQVRAEPADARSDIFALGSVLYEMTTGKRAFRGPSSIETMNAILNAEPDSPAQSGEVISPALERILNRCLEKRPEQRFQSSRDLAFALESVTGSTADSWPALERAPVEARRSIPGLAWGLMAVAAIVGALAGAFWRGGNATGGVTTTTWLDLDLERGLSRLMTPSFVLSPDGRAVAYSTESNGGVYMRDLGSRESTFLEGTRGAATPFFSADGKWIGFFAQRELRKVPVEGGASLKIAESVSGNGGSWTPDDTIYYAPSYNSGIHRIPASGGESIPITTLDLEAKESSHSWPQALPDDRGVLFTIETSGKTFDDASIVVVPVNGGPRKVLVEGGTFGRYVASGHLLYARNGSLLSAPMDLDRLELTGAPVVVVRGVLSTRGRGAALYDVASNGTLAFVPWKPGEARSTTYSEAFYIAEDGTATPTPHFGESYSEPALSPDGRRMMINETSSNDNNWVIDLDRGTRTRLTFEAENSAAVWMPDGERIVLASDRDGKMSNLYLFAADGTGVIERLTHSDIDQDALDVSPDGKTLLYAEVNPESGADIWLLPLEGDRTPEPWRATPFRESSAGFSPEGDRIVYASDDTGRPEIYIQDFDKSDRVQVTTSGGHSPRWSPDGRAIFYVTDNVVYSVTIGRGSRPTIGEPREWYRSVSGISRYRYTVADDPLRLIVIETVEEPPFQRLKIALNWF